MVEGAAGGEEGDAREGVEGSWVFVASGECVGEGGCGEGGGGEGGGGGELGWEGFGDSMWGSDGWVLVVKDECCRYYSEGLVNI